MLFMLGVLPVAFAQYAWFRQFSGNGYVVGTNLSIGNNDAIYTIGNFNNDVSVFGHSFSGPGSYIVKVTKHGDLSWVHPVIYDGNDALNQIRSDGAGNIYITGTCNQGVTLGGQSIPGAQNTSYVAKLTGDGQLQWYQRIPVQNIIEIDVNQQGDLVLIGRLAGSITLGGNSLSCSSCSFGAALTTNGTFHWARTFGNQSMPISTTIDDDGNTYFNGTFWADFSLDGKSAVATGQYTLFYARMDNLGTCSWLTSVKQTESPDASPNIVQYGAMKADANGNLFVGGHYFMSAEFGNNVLHGSTTNEHATSLYISKFDSDGNVDWAVPRVNHSTGNSIDNSVIKNNTVFVAGQDGFHVFIYAYSMAGDFIHEIVLSQFRGDISGGFGIDAEDSLYVSGRINDYSVNKITAFILKLGIPAIPLPANTVHAPLVQCATAGIEITTTAIEHAEVYQWEIRYGDKTVMIETAGPALVFIPGAYGIDGEYQIRVRGKNANGTGYFSSHQTVRMDFALSELQIEKQCDKIVAKTRESFTWYFNGAPASYPEGQTEISPQEAGEYAIKQENACGQSESNILNYVKAGAPFIPNIITPDGDDFNEFFDLSGFDGNTSVFIYDRWGSQVFQSRAYTSDWNGDKLSSGVYFYLVKNPCFDKPMTGPLTIMR
jgi:gliding motility-associated-like protein